jgi:hypothetical protein
MKRLLKSQIYIIMVAFLVSCSSYGRSNLKPDKNARGDIYNILHFASLAGSSHNSQPWKVDVFGQDSILVYADLSRKLPVVDKTNRELYISVGAFIENLDIAARCYGYRTIIHIYEFKNDENSPVASVLLTKTGAMKNTSDLKEIELRNTLRIPFETRQIKSSDLEHLVSIDPESIHFIASTSEKGKLMADNELKAYTAQAYNNQAQKELASWIRFSNKDVKEKQDGLSTAGMGIQGISGFVVRNFFSPDDSKKESFVAKGIEKTKLLVENCGGWVVITQKSNNLADWINTGRLYERLNLKCRKLGLGFHPMSQTLEELESGTEFNNFLELPGQLMFVARIGYVDKYPAPVSLRRPVECFTNFR